MQQRVFENGYKINHLFKDDVAEWRNRIEVNKKASMLVVVGGVGCGKTTFAINAGEMYQDKPLVFRDQLANGGDNFMRKLGVCMDKKHKVCIYDEAGDFSSNRSISKFNNDLNRVLDICRAFKIFLIIILPDLLGLDKRVFRKGIVRGVVHVTRNNLDYANYEMYSLYAAFFLKDKMTKLIVPMTAYKYATASYTGRCLDLEPERSDELEKYSLEGKKDILSELLPQNKKKGFWKLSEMVKESGYSKSKVYLAINKAKVQPTVKEGNCNYYSEPQKMLIFGELQR